MQTILVTGGAGFIGSHIVDANLARGHEAARVDNLSTGRIENLAHVKNNIEFIQADLCDAAAMTRAVAGVDCIFHQAALASVPRSVERPLDTHAACATGTLVLLDAAKKAKVRRVVYAASSSAYGDQPTSSKRETDLPAPISPYGAAKPAAELYCRAFAAMNAVETVCAAPTSTVLARGKIPTATTRPSSQNSLPPCSPVNHRAFSRWQQSRDSPSSPMSCKRICSRPMPRTFLAASSMLPRDTKSACCTDRSAKQAAGHQREAQSLAAGTGDIRESLADITQCACTELIQPQIHFEEARPIHRLLSLDSLSSLDNGLSPSPADVLSPGS